MGTTSRLHRLTVMMAIGTMTIALTANQAPALIGTAVLTGTLVTDSVTPQPVRRATVRLAGAPGTSARAVGTDDGGRFTFTALPAGSFTLSALKPGFVTTFHGSKHPGRGPGVPIAIADGARMDVTLPILPGAAITGSITDVLGNPTPGVTVAAVDLRPVAPAPPVRVTSDDRGVYRIFGLAPGDYLVSALPRLVPTSAGRSLTNAETLGMTDAEVQWARGLGPARAMPTPGRLVAYVPVFYPGTTDAAAAQRVTVSAGEERSGVSMAIRIVNVATIAGTLVEANGQAVSPATVTLFPRRSDTPTMASALVSSGALVLPRGTVTPAGFSIAGVAPGEYTIVARSGGTQRGAPPPDPAGPGPLWNVTDISVDGNDRSDLVLRLLPGLRLSGTIVFERTAETPPSDLSTLEISFTASGTNLGTASSPRAIVDRSGAFRFAGIPPGTYALTTMPPGGWVLKSAVLNGRDLADAPLDVRASGETTEGLVMTFTDRSAEIAGQLIDAGGRPVTRYAIVVFATDRSFWRPNARRIRLTQPATDGSFAVGGLPPGEYAIAAAEDIVAADLADPAVLMALLASSVKLTIAEGEKKRQDLRVVK
jgi:hypothetical protein